MLTSPTVIIDIFDGTIFSFQQGLFSDDTTKRSYIPLVSCIGQAVGCCVITYIK
jgi:hypothetical protein